MTNIENHRISTVLVAIAALASVLVVSTSAMSGHIVLAQTNSGANSNSGAHSNSGIDSSISNSATQTCESSGGGSTISSSCTGTQSNSNSNTGGVH